MASTATGRRDVSHCWPIRLMGEARRERRGVASRQRTKLHSNVIVEDKPQVNEPWWPQASSLVVAHFLSARHAQFSIFQVQALIVFLYTLCQKCGKPRE